MCEYSPVQRSNLLSLLTH